MRTLLTSIVIIEMYSKGSSIHMIFTHVFTLEFAAVIASA